MAFSTDVALLLSLFTVLFLSNFNGFVRVEASHDYLLKNLRYNSSKIRHNDRQPYRTAYHFQPRQNWMNDPNGPMIYKGIYHLFYQYNPKGPFFSNYIVWGHSTSTDLVNWTPQAPALKPSIPSDLRSCWSGSATILPNNEPAILYTGQTLNQYQVQNLAFPKTLNDPYLKEWVKYPKNPIIAPSPTDKVNASAFRDPSTAWMPPDGVWRLVIGTTISGRALAALYRSTDFVHWVKVKHPLYYESGVGMWECVDFYPVAKDSRFGIDTSIVGSSVKHVFKVSRDETRHDVYVIGKYDYRRDVFFPDEGSSIGGDSGFRYDYGVFYASKTFYDAAKRRRILWDWVYETSSLRENLKKGWAGIQAIPRTILLDKGGKQLVQWPIEEIEKLRGNEVKLTHKVIKGGSTIQVIGINPLQADVDISFKVREVDLKKVEKLDSTKWSDPKQLCSRRSVHHHHNHNHNDNKVKRRIGPFGVLTLASKSLEEYTAVSFSIFKNHAHKPIVLMCSDQSRSSFNSNPDGDDDEENKYYGAFVNVDPLHEELSLRTLIDHSVVESFGAEGRSCITARVYPRLAIDNNARLYVYNNGTESIKITRFRAWSMRKARIN